MSNLDNRNQQSWNIYNEVKAHSPQDRKVTKSATPKKPRKSESDLNDISPKNTSDKSNTPQTPSRMKATHGVSAPSSVNQLNIESSWWYLFGNMIHSIENVFQACIEMQSEESCNSAYGALYSHLVEFQRLSNYFEAQRRFVYGQPIAWEIPKGYVSSGQSQESKLNATAEAFQPASFQGEVPTLKMPAASSSTASVAGRATESTAAAEVPSVLLKAVMSGEDAVPAHPVSSAAPSVIKTYRERAMTESVISSQKASVVSSSSSLALSAKPVGKQVRSNSSVTAPVMAKPSLTRGTSSSLTATVKDNQAWEDQTDRIVREEMNKVMKAAERMVEEAEMEEEQQWAALHSKNTTTNSGAVVGGKKPMGPLELHIDSSEFETPRNSQRMSLFGALPSGSMISPPSFGHRKSSNASSTVISGTMTPNTTTGGAVASSTGPKSPFSRTGSPYGLAPGSGANAFLTPSGSAAGRSLHDKFSSPDRKKSYSPDEVRRRSEARMHNATVNRDLSNAEKVKRAKVSSDRVKVVEQSLALKSAQLHQQIEDRQNQADVRRQEKLNSKKERAGNENTKVEEVQFINSLNSEGFADELSKKLAEAEAKALSAAERRQSILENKSLQQRRKNSKKAQQVSEYKMETEKLTIQRFEAMKERMLAVEARKQERLALKAQPHVAAAAQENENKSASTANAETSSSALVGAVTDKTAVMTQKYVAIAEPPSDSKESPSSARNAKAKAKRQKKQLRKSEVVSTVSQPRLTIAVADLPTTAVSSATVTVSPAVVQVIVDCYQSMINSLTKKVVLSNRLAYIEAAKCEPINPPADASPRASFIVPTGQNEFTGMNGLLNSFLSAFAALNSSSGSGRHFVLARQLLAAQVPVNSSGPTMMREGSLESGTPSHGTERQVRFNIPLVLCTVDLTSTQSVTQFISEGGVLLLRVLLGYEVGILCGESSFVEVLNCPVDPTLGKSLGLMIFELVRVCAQNPEGLAQLYATGSPVLLSDIATVLFDVQDTLGKEAIHVKGSAAPKTASESASEGGFVDFPYCVAALLPQVVSCLSVIVEGPSATALVETDNSPSDQKISAGSLSLALPVNPVGFALSAAAADSFLWYLFSANVYTALCDSLRADLLCLQYRQSYANTFSSSSGCSTKEYRLYSSVEAQESVITSCGFIAAIAERLRLSGRSEGPASEQLTKSLTQLSPTAHSHPQGKKIVSLVRRSEVVPVLISLAHALILEFEQLNQPTLKSATAVAGASTTSTTPSKSRRGNVKPAVDLTSGPISIANQFRVYHAITQALHSIGSADISLVQSLSKNHQTLLVAASSYLIRSHVNSLDDGNTINVFASQPVISPPAGLLKVFTKSDAEESIRRLLLALTLCCLRCSDLQRECSSVGNLTSMFCPPILSNHQQTSDKAATKTSSNTTNGDGVVSLLVTLCRLSNKFYKDRKFKQALHPCLISMTLDVDANINVVRSEGKIPQIVKYLEFYIFEHNKYFGPGSTNGSVSVGESALDAESRETKERIRASNMAMVVNFSRLVPSDSWNTSLLTYN